ncbi:Uncharacterised protein [Vibrio cholerae]|nr:Uncharacterised protein [Vibrio cholerae]
MPQNHSVISKLKSMSVKPVMKKHCCNIFTISCLNLIRKSRKSLKPRSLLSQTCCTILLITIFTSTGWKH